jgi:hypothetical protein
MLRIWTTNKLALPFLDDRLAQHACTNPRNTISCNSQCIAPWYKLAISWTNKPSFSLVTRCFYTTLWLLRIKFYYIWLHIWTVEPNRLVAHLSPKGLGEQCPLHQGSLWTTTSAQMGTGGERPRPCPAASVHPGYMYKRRQRSINRSQIHCLNHLSQSLFTLFTTRYQALRFTVSVHRHPQRWVRDKIKQGWVWSRTSNLPMHWWTQSSELWTKLVQTVCAVAGADHIVVVGGVLQSIGRCPGWP